MDTLIHSPEEGTQSLKWLLTMDPRVGEVLTDATVEAARHAVGAHLLWASFSGVKDARGLEHPPMRGWLAVPVLRPTGELLGVLQLSDNYGDADFTSADLDLLIHLAPMQFLQPDLHPTNTLPVRPLEFYSERYCFPSLDSLSVQQPREPSAHYVMAYPRSRRRHPYSGVSRGTCTWQGVVP